MYPLKFKSVIKKPIWGSEIWLVSAIKGSESHVLNGAYIGNTLPELIAEHTSDMVGKQVFSKFGDTFPLLIKFILANDDLSVQVHPDDELALKRHQCMGKNEMWYVLGASDGARLLSGFKEKISKDEYISRVDNNNIVEVLNNCFVNIADVFYLPAGRVHAIGGGCSILEIQQSSDITYRIYDYDRTDGDGNRRELHTAQAIDAIDYRVVSEPCGRVGFEKEGDLVRCKHFCVREFSVKEYCNYDYVMYDSFVILICIEGNGIITWEDDSLNKNDKKINLDKIEWVFLPASLGCVTLEGNMHLIEVMIPIFN